MKKEKAQDPLHTLPLPPHGDHNVTTLLNPFAISPPSSLQHWHEARSALSNPAYFYTTMHRFGSINEVLKRGEDGVKEEEPERFPVRVREITLEVEQGLADLRMLLNECLRVEDAAALRALRDRVKGALVFK
jgi:hypothetical protein